MQGQISKTMPLVSKGQRISARDINDISEAVTRLTQGLNSPKQVILPRTAQTGGAGALFARLCTTANHSLTGLAAFDGVTPSAADPIFVPFQDTVAQNGIYSASAGAWSMDQAFNSDVLYQPVFIAQGNVFGQSHWFVTAANVAQWQRLAYRAKVATTATHGLTGTANVDSVSISAGDLVLAWIQTTASQNGLYLVTASGTWKKIASFAAADVGVTIGVALGTLYGKLNFIATAANTVVAGGAVLL